MTPSGDPGAMIGLRQRIVAPSGDHLNNGSSSSSPIFLDDLNRNPSSRQGRNIGSKGFFGRPKSRRDEIKKYSVQIKERGANGERPFDTRSPRLTPIAPSGNHLQPVVFATLRSYTTDRNTIEATSFYYKTVQRPYVQLPELSSQWGQI